MSKKALAKLIQGFVKSRRSEAAIRGLFEVADAARWISRAAKARKYAAPGNMHGWFADWWQWRGAMHLTSAALYASIAVGLKPAERAETLLERADGPSG